MQIDPYLSPSTELKSKWIKDPNIKTDTLNMIEEKMGDNLVFTGTEHNFLSGITIAQTLRSTINTWDLMNKKIFCRAKDTVR